jgi:hypothetical protein
MMITGKLVLCRYCKPLFEVTYALAILDFNGVSGQSTKQFNNLFHSFFQGDFRSSRAPPIRLHRKIHAHGRDTNAVAQCDRFDGYRLKQVRPAVGMNAHYGGTVTPFWCGEAKV